MEKSTSVGIKWGLTLGGILAAFTVVIYSIDISLFVNTAVSLIPMIIVIAIGIMVAKEYKAQNKGFGSFGDLFNNLLVAFAIGALISLVIKYILFSFIDPAAAEQIMELTIEKTADMMDSFGVEMPEDALDKMAETNPYALKNIITSFVSVTFGNIIFALIIAAITKNEKPEFE
jgi:hypothetical protein